jgi:hypothetical protein
MKRKARKPGTCRLAAADFQRQEVDFVVEAGGKLLPIEVKSTARPRLGDAAHLRTFRAEYGKKARAIESVGARVVQDVEMKYFRGLSARQMSPGARRDRGHGTVRRGWMKVRLLLAMSGEYFDDVAFRN